MKDISTRELIFMILATVGSFTGVGNTVWESQIETDSGFYASVSENKKSIEEIQEEIISLRIQKCLMINEINRVAGRDELQQCSP